MYFVPEIIKTKSLNINKINIDMYCQNYGEYKSSNKVPYRSLYMVLVYDNRIHTIKYNIFEPYRNKYPNIV